VVAVAVAMGFRAYFIQPFKIPTGSMQPTLYGIHYRHQTAAGLTDLYPLRPVKWLVFGEWYCEFPARASGTLRGPLGETNGNLAYEIGGVLHAVPRDLPLECAPGEPVIRGQMLARGLRTTGDHIFVNKVAWYFTRPRRGDVMVFSTDHIPSLHEKKTHYIKRLVGLPGERIRVDPPNLLVNERRVDRPRSVTRIEERVGEYAGYQNPPGAGGRHLVTPRSVMTLAPTDYLGLGDNTLNSYDGRYWGPVPRGNLVGPAFGVYWPLSRRWGPIR
jgi:signal peptidase I